MAGVEDLSDDTRARPAGESPAPLAGKTVNSYEMTDGRTSLAVLGLVLLLIFSSLIEAAYRRSLPTDGWNFRRDTTGGGQRLVFDRNLAGWASGLQPGDVLVAVDGQPYAQILSAALALSPQRPSDWAMGRTVTYTVMRGGQNLAVPVTLARMPVVQAVRNALRTLALDPGPLLTLLLAVYVFYRHPRHSAAQLLLVFGAAVFASDGISQAVTGSNLVGPAELFYRGAYWPSVFFISLVWPLVIAPIFIQLAISFPVAKGPMRRYPQVTLAVLYCWLPALMEGFVVATSGRPLQFWQMWTTSMSVYSVFVPVVMIVSMLHTLMTVREGERAAQIRWMAAGILVTMLGDLAGNVIIAMGLVTDTLVLGWVATRWLLLGYPVSLAIAILRYRLFDIDFIIRRTLIYATVTTALAGVYFVGVFVSQQIFRAVTGASSPLAIVLSTLAIAALFNPLRNQVQEIVNRQFYRRKYDMVRTLEAFGASLRNEVELDRLTENLKAAIGETMQPESVSLWLIKPPEVKRPTDDVSSSRLAAEQPMR